MTNLLVRAAYCLLVFVIAAVSLALLFRVPQLFSLMRHHSETKGTVVSTDVKNHLSITVQYFADNAKRERTFSGYAWPLGAVITVFYDSANPDNAAAEDPSRVFRSQLLFCLMCSLAVTAVSVLYLFGPSWMGASLRKTVISPKVSIAIISVCALAGTAFNLTRQGPRPLPLVSALLVGGGCMVFLVRIKQMAPQSGWKAFMHSRQFLSGVLLILAGILVG